MQASRPILTLAIPTYNRMGQLAELLTVLKEQAAIHPEVEILVSDNASADETTAIVQRFIDEDMQIDYHRHAVNIGADANFVSCFHRARGKYFWICGDDDIIVPGALDTLVWHLQQEEFDLVYLTSYGFRTDYVAERQADPFGRRSHIIRSELHYSKAVNIMFTFISGMVVNKDRLLEIPHEDPSAFIGSTLVQLSWTLPLLLRHRRSLILWDRLVAARQGNTGGYAIGEVFGDSLFTVIQRCLKERPDLAATILNFSLRRWFPSILYDVRLDPKQTLSIGSAQSGLQRTYGNNVRYWLFTYPVLKLPLPLAGIWLRIGAVVSKLIYLVVVPGFWRKEVRF